MTGRGKNVYGHNSLLGATFVISIQNGCVLDYSIKSKTCSVCKKNRVPSEEWKKSHEPFCQINHKGSSGSMEKEGAVEMFLQSIDKHNLKYTEYIGDGDSNSFGAVKKALSEKYGDDYDVRKEDCIGHIQKRMGSALRTYKNNSKGIVLSDGKSVGGVGRLTDKVIDRIQTYYGYAIRNNKGNDEKIIRAVWAIFYHLILGPSYESLEAQHSYCPSKRLFKRLNLNSFFEMIVYIICIYVLKVNFPAFYSYVFHNSTLKAFFSKLNFRELAKGFLKNGS